MERLYKVKIPVENDLLYRRKKTLPQKDLNPEARLKNLEEAFEAGEISGDIRRVILVDDIYTTGSTADACAKVLKRAGDCSSKGSPCGDHMHRKPIGAVTTEALYLMREYITKMLKSIAFLF